MKSVGLAMIVRDAEQTLDLCLQSVRGLFDQVVIVDTGSKDGTLEIIKRHNAELYHFEWVKDFSAARNFSFDKLQTDFAFWLDSDDILIGKEHFEDLIARTEEHAADGAVLEYLYSFSDDGNEFLARAEPHIIGATVPTGKIIEALKVKCNTTQWRERLVRRDPAWRWVYPIHEAMPVAGKKIIRYDGIKVIHRRHLIKAVDNSNRNIEILEAVPANKRDERIWFYFGLEYATAGKIDPAIHAFQQYVPLASNEDELYLANHYLADLYRAKDQQVVAIEHDLRAVALRPTWRDAYAGLLQSYAKMEVWNKAIYYGAMVKRAEVPDTPYAYNPLHEEIGWVGDYVKALVAVGELQEALAESTRALAIVPGDTNFQYNVDALSVRLNISQGTRTIANAIEFFLRHDDADTASLLISRIPSELYNDADIRAWIQVCGSVCAPANRGTFVPDAIKFLPGTSYENDGPWGDYRLKHLMNHLAARPRIKRVLQVGGPVETKAAWKDMAITVERASNLNEIQGSWDGIVLWNCLERAKNPDQVVALARAALAPGGELMAYVPNGPATKGLAPPDASRARLRAYGVDAFRQVMGTVRMPEIISGGAADAGEMFLYDPLPVRGRPKRIAIVAPGAPEPWWPPSLQTGIGGSEEAVIRLSRAFSRRGHQVIVYGSGHEYDDHGFEGFDPSNNCRVLYRDLKKYEPADVLLGWRHPELFINQLRPFEAEWKALWLHDSQSFDRVMAASSLVDCVWCISAHHASLYPGVPNIYVGRNGIDPHDMPGLREVERNPAKLVYVSTPFRGLDTLLGVFPAIRAAVPEAELHCYYGWESADKMGATSSPEGKAFKDHVTSLAASTSGVVWHGRVGQQALYREVASAGVWAYPTRWHEEHCISAYIAQACGAWPVVYPLGALPQSVVFGKKVRQEKFTEAVVEMIRTEDGRDDMMNWVRANTSWDNVAAMWERLWLGMSA